MGSTDSTKDDKTLATKILRRLLLDSNYSRLSNFVMKFSENSQKMPQKKLKKTYKHTYSQTFDAFRSDWFQPVIFILTVRENGGFKMKKRD